MYQHQLDLKQEEKKQTSQRQSAADLRMSPRQGLAEPGQILLSLQGRYGNRHVQRVVDATRQGSRAAPLQAKPAEPSPNRTGLPDGLKAGIEALSGFSLDGASVHYNSSKPAQVQALAYTLGTQIHIAPGQERHLPHEAWHVVQQLQGRVQPTTQIQGGVKVNDDKGLEKEADVMGARAVQQSGAPNNMVTIKRSPAVPKAAPDDILQGEFVVGVSVKRSEEDGERIVAKIEFGERPNTQFGATQQDHILAWTMKLNQISDRIVGLPLRDAAGELITIIDDTAHALGNRDIMVTAHLLGQAVQEAVRNGDALDLQQALQKFAKVFLEQYNLDPNVTQERKGKADKGEGARVRKAKNEVFDKYASIQHNKVTSDVVEEFINTFFKTIQKPELKNDMEAFVNYGVLLTSTALGIVEGGGLAYFPSTIIVKICRRIAQSFNLSKKDGYQFYKLVRAQLKIRGFDLGE